MIPDLDRPVVVIVDDLPLMRRMTKLLLTKLFHNVKIVECEDGHAAWESIQQNRPDLLIADIYMPKMGGLELLSEIRANEQLASLPVILVTATNHPQDQELAIKLGVDKLFYRPIPLKEFEELLKEFIGKKPDEKGNVAITFSI